MGVLDDSVTYQAAVAEYTRRGRLEGLAEGERHGEQRGHQLGHQQGLRQGLHQGLKEGELQGKQQEAQALVLVNYPAAAVNSARARNWRCEPCRWNNSNPWLAV